MNITVVSFYGLAVVKMSKAGETG